MWGSYFRGQIRKRVQSEQPPEMRAYTQDHVNLVNLVDF